MPTLTAKNAFIFRITHINNMPWIFQNGIHCPNSANKDPNFVSIGLADLIQSRSTRIVPTGPGGHLSDYIPFYFTPWSIMMYNIRTGYRGVKHIPNNELVILVSSLHHISKNGVPFVFTNQHAYPVAAQYFDNLADLNKIDWPILEAKDFRYDVNDLGRKERYQAEALIYQTFGISELLGVGCRDDMVKAQLQTMSGSLHPNLQIKTTPTWYFP